MKLFNDKNLSEQVETLDLGIVEAGNTARFSFYVYNDSLANLKNLIFKIDNIETKIIQAPKELEPKKSAELIIEWTPSVTLKQGLHARLEINGIELWS